MTKRNRSRGTRAQRLCAPLVDDFVDLLIGRSWLTITPKASEAADPIKSSFNHDFIAMMSFLSQVTDGRVRADTLAYASGQPEQARLVNYAMLSDLKDDLPTLIQFPALLQEPWDSDEAQGWARLFAPTLRPNENGRTSSSYDMRASFDEIREMRAAGVPLAYAAAMGRGAARYDTTGVIEMYRAGLAPEFGLAL